MKIKDIKYIGLIGLIGLIGPMTASAQSSSDVRVYFQSVGLDKTAAGTFRVNIYVDSRVAINTYEIDFKFPEELLTYLRADTAGSIINVMPEEIFADAGGRIYIRGGSTKAFLGDGGLLASLYFKPKRIGSGTIGFISATVHLADGKGTTLLPVAYQSDLSITGLAKVSENVTNIPIDVERELAEVKLVTFDNNPPEITFAKLEKNPFDDAEWLLVFDGTDKESGISHFLVREKQWFMFSEYQRAINPYSITPGAWAVELTAVDNFGNEISRTFYRFDALLYKLLFIILVLLALWFLRKMFRLYRMHRKQVQTSFDWTGKVKKIN